jgi:hypothetical protein
MASVVDRDAVVLFAATANETVPFPVPEDADVMATHDAPLVAVHVHPAGPAPVTATDPVPPLLLKDWLFGESVANEHADGRGGGGGGGGGAGAACCDTPKG